ncbi:MAG: Flp/Fap pilin component [Bacillales bacterium]|jgi:pilus assembly protein Flp/PilA|nr:Flp/Fap pilin component [Bacillales bacterium]
MGKFLKVLKDEDGQGMVEYGLLIGLIAIVVIGALILLGPKIKDLFTKVTNELPATTP